MRPGTPRSASLPTRARLARSAAVAVSATSRRVGLGGGSVIGGRVGLLLAPDLLRRLAAGRLVGLVSATNGKTTTTRLLATALGGAPAVATSVAGANLPAGLAVALAVAPADAPAVLEVDEGYLGAVADAVHPRVVALLNLSRDQLDRVSEVRMVARRWRDALAGTDATVVANADDPLVTWAAEAAPRVIWVAAGLLWHDDAVGCPACEGRIVFDGPEGWCCSCGFRRPAPDARLQGDELVTADGRRLPLHLVLPGRANRANAAMAAVAAAVLGVDEADALRSMETVSAVEGRFATVTHAGVTARLLLAKNPAGWMELLDMLEGGVDPVVIGINARVVDGYDPSWLWDVAFERLAGRLAVATGERCRDLAVRLRYAGISHMTVPAQPEAVHASGASRLDYVGNYTAFQGLRRALRAGAPRHPRAGAPPPVVVARPVPVARPAPDAPSVPAGRADAATGDTASTDAAGTVRGGVGGASTLRVVVVHPDLLGTYGDGGNGRVLAARAAWRGMPVELVLASSDRPLPASADLYCLGGGEDGPQVLAAARLADGTLARAVEAGATVLAVCAGYQVLGTTFPGADGRPHPGVGLLDVETVKGPGRRAVGEIVAVPVEGSPVGVTLPAGVHLDRLTGFENHAGVTRLGPSVRPLARVVTGVGNGTAASPEAPTIGGRSAGHRSAGRRSAGRTEGAWSGRVVGTYLHGPVLARNPSLADMLVALATGTAPARLDDEEEEALRAERLAHARARGRGGRAPWGRLVRTRRT